MKDKTAKRQVAIRLIMPRLSPRAAYAFSALMKALSYEVERHYVEEIQSHTYTRGRELLEGESIEVQIEQDRKLDEASEFDDSIPF